MNPIVSLRAAALALKASFGKDAEFTVIDGIVKARVSEGDFNHDVESVCDVVEVRQLDGSYKLVKNQDNLVVQG